MLESVPVLMLVTCISVFTGFILNTTFSLGDIIGILVMTPALLSTGGNVGTSYGARITTSLHSGLIEPRFKRVRMIYINFFAIYITGILVTVLIGFVGFFISILIGPPTLSLAQYIILAVSAGAIDFIIVLFLSLSTAFISFRHGLDPDNIVAPIVTTLADLIGICSIYLILNLII